MADRAIPNAGALKGWRKSSYSNDQGGSCLEVLDDHPAGVPVRDSKAPEGPRWSSGRPAGRCSSPRSRTEASRLDVAPPGRTLPRVLALRGLRVLRAAVRPRRAHGARPPPLPGTAPRGRGGAGRSDRGAPPGCRCARRVPSQPRCVGANMRSTAGRTTTEGPGVERDLVRSSSRVSGVVRTPGTPKDSARAT